MVEVAEIELDRIQPNRMNPRLHIHIEKLHELADSIGNIGVLEPIIVRPKGNMYEVVVGERRYRASRQAGLKKVPAIIGNFTDEQVIELNLIENIQREDLNAVEKGNCCKQLLEKYPEKYPSRQAVSKRISVSPDTIGNWIKLTEAPPEIQEMIVSPDKAGIPREMGKLDYSAALAITRKIKEPKRQVEVAREIAVTPVHGRKLRKTIERAATEPGRPLQDIVKELTDEPCELAFNSSEKALILTGAKTQVTSAARPDARIQVGKMIYASVVEPHFARLRVVSVERRKLKYFGKEDASAEGNQSLEEFQRAWKRKHGEWDDNQLVYVVRFEKT